MKQRKAPRAVRTIPVCAWGALALAGAAACQIPEEPDPQVINEQAELWALLRDDELTSISPAALRPERDGSGVSALARAQTATPDAGVGTDAGGPPPPFPVPFGRWSFDDCSPFRTNLFDSTFNGNTAFRSVSVTCAEGVGGQGVALAMKEDIVYVPDQPNFTFENGVTVAAWVKPTAIGGTKTLIRKRDKGESSFALLLNGGKFQLVVNLGAGRAASVTSPAKAKANVFQHVAGTFDGTTLRLYVGGVEVTTFTVPGAIPPGPGPLLIGNDGSERRMNGVIDNVVFEGRALSADEVQELTCVRAIPTVDITPRNSAPTPGGTTASFDVAITNHSAASCSPSQFVLFPIFGGDPTIAFDPPFGNPKLGDPIASGATGHISFTATPSPDTEPNVFTIGLLISSQDPFTNFQTVETVTLEVAETTACHVSTRRELMITDVSVVDDPIRTSAAGPPDDPRTGAWTFKRLVENLAPTPADAPALVEQMLESFGTAQTINGFTVQPRPGMQDLILASWPRTPEGELDLAQAPLRLQAIVDRFDLRDLAAGDAGEGRFVFAFTAPDGFFPLQATLILEYKLPAANEADVQAWANAFHALGALPFSEEYNAALQTITDGFAGRLARPGFPNGSALNVLRTNELDFGQGAPWELREFRLSPIDGFLAPSTVDLTPDLSFNNSDTLATFINDNASAIIAEEHTVPLSLDGQPFRGGAVFNDPFNLDTWFAPGTDPEARHHFALNTCNGCHSATETGTGFTHINPRFPGNEAFLSGFLRGITVFDPVTGTPRTLNDLARRNADLKAVVCTEPSARSRPNLSKGISRVH